MSVLPIRPDWDSLPWWRALEHHVLLVQQCAECERFRWPARAVCNACASWDSEWVWARGEGTVASWIVTMRTFSPGPAVPYVTVLIRLAEQNDIFIPGTLRGSTSDLAIGASALIGFDRHRPESSEVTVDGEPLPETLLHWILKN